jgi:biotin-(acetyl-CoA carboxylase) ligase
MVVAEPPQGATLLPLGVGVMAGAGIDGRFGMPTVLKWPNDLLVVRPPEPPRKLVGTLTDRVEGPNGPSLAVGVGVNVSSRRSEFPEPVRDRVAILSDYVRTPPPLDQVESVVVDAIEQVGVMLRTESGRDRLLSACRSALYGVGRRALVDGRPAGVIRALGDDGALWLQDGHHRVPVRAGSVAVVEGT